jgi:hypothetical protein
MSRIADASVALQEFVVARIAASQDVADALGVDLADVSARIWDSTPPPDADLPYIDVTVGTPDDVNTVPMVEVMVRGEVTVKVVGQAEAYEPVSAVYKPVHAALQGRVSVPLNGDGVVLSSRRLRSIAYPEQVNGIEYRHLGGTYEVFVQ